MSKLRRLVQPNARIIGIGLAAAVTALGSLAAPAAAVPLPPLKPPAIKPPPIRPFEVRPPATANLDQLGQASRFGADDSTTFSALDEANTGVIRDFDATAERVAAKAEARARVKECGGEALSAAGESYAEDVQEAVYAEAAVPAPDFTEMSAAMAGCLERYFPNTPEDLFQTAKSFADQAVERAKEARTADPSAAALANWLTATGADLSTGTAPPPEPDDSSFPWWIVGVGVVLGGGVVFAVRGSSKP